MGKEKDIIDSFYKVIGNEVVRYLDMGIDPMNALYTIGKSFVKVCDTLDTLTKEEYKLLELCQTK